MDTEGNQFGHKRVIESILKSDNTPQDIGNHLIEEVSEFEDESVDNDDTCLVCFGRS